MRAVGLFKSELILFDRANLPRSGGGLGLLAVQFQHELELLQGAPFDGCDAAPGG
jgi:hypothetical protein